MFESFSSISFSAIQKSDGTKAPVSWRIAIRKD